MFETKTDDKIKRIVISEEEIKDRIRSAGRQLSVDYAGKPLLIVGILNGAFMFMADLCRAITIPCEMGFMKAKSYYNGVSAEGDVKILLDVPQDLSKYHVIVAEDIIDTGRTLSCVAEKLRERKPLSLKIITLLDKPSRRTVDFNADMSLFVIPDFFAVGYGLDCGGHYRNLPYIAEYSEDN